MESNHVASFRWCCRALCGHPRFLNACESASIYTTPSTPGTFADDNTPVDNPSTDAGAILGHVLFDDMRVSGRTSRQANTALATSTAAIAVENTPGITKKYSHVMTAIAT